MLSRRRFLMTALALSLPSSLRADDKGKLLRLVADEWPPYEFAPGAEMQGYGVELTEAVLQQMGYAVKRLPVLAPWIRVLAMVSKGEADVTASALWSEERARTGRFPKEPLFETRYAIFGSYGKTDPFPQIADLAGLRLGIVHGYLYPDEFLKALPPSTQVIASYDAISNLQSLHLGHVDVVLEDERTAPFLIHQHQWGDRINPSPRLRLTPYQLYALFSATTVSQEVVEEFSHRLADYKHSTAAQALATRYQMTP